MRTIRREPSPRTARNQKTPEMAICATQPTQTHNQHAAKYSAGRMWMVLLALLLRFRPCLRSFGLVWA